MFGPVRPWNNENDNTRDSSHGAKPYLKVMTQSGYYDGATYFAAKFRNGKWILVGNYATVFRLKATEVGI